MSVDQARRRVRQTCHLQSAECPRTGSAARRRVVWRERRGRHELEDPRSDGGARKPYHADLPPAWQGERRAGMHHRLARRGRVRARAAHRRIRRGLNQRHDVRALPFMGSRRNRPAARPVMLPRALVRDALGQRCPTVMLHDASQLSAEQDALREEGYEQKCRKATNHGGRVVAGASGRRAPRFTQDNRPEAMVSREVGQLLSENP